MSMPKTTALKPHRPWKANLAWIGYTLVVIFAGWFFLYQKGKHEEFIFLALLGGTIVVVNSKSFFARVHGQLVEHAAIKSLEKIDKSRVTRNKPLPGRGDIDVIYKAKEDTYNIEIKSVQDPRKVTKKHIRQVLDASDYTRTLPVIWLPKAPNKMIVNRGGVTIICGNARQLVSYLN